MTELRRTAILALTVTLILAGGCVERTMKIDTSPQGARVFVNDEEVGVSPARFSFTWYGDYDIVIRKEGYETARTHYRVNPPWHQFPPFDLIAETMIPGTIKDEHNVPTIELVPLGKPEVQALVQRAAETRDQTLYKQ